ncbi:hypothetical protein WJX73_002603 [Symbiochloris irregularis]|uniref:Eukaryotic translation initiation factor 4B n=1 Tax=Symbiochloris irregularis TaxID=706552 RepID=A0AAW1NSL5_9CHLO
MPQDVEEEEASGGILGPPPVAPSAALGGADAFPSLGEAGKVSKKDKRKKGQSVSLAEFQSGSSAARGSAFVPSAARYTPSSRDVDVQSLPTGPRERSAEEADRSGGLGGAFSRGGYGRGRDDDDEFNSRAPREDDGPSRADMADDWGKDRKFVAGGSSDRGSGFSSRGFEPSRAEGEGTWGRSRASSRDDQEDSRPASRGFEDRGDYAGPSKADTEDRWGSTRSFVPSAAPPRGEANGDRWGSRRSSSPLPPAGPSDTTNRPRLALKPRTLPVPDLPPPRPREEVLKQQGRDIAQPSRAADNREGDGPQGAEELQSRIAELRARIDVAKSTTAGSEQNTDEAKPSAEDGVELYSASLVGTAVLAVGAQLMAAGYT